MQSLFFCILYSVIPSSLIYAIIKPFYNGFEFMPTFITIFIILVLILSYTNFQVFKIIVEENNLTIKYFIHREEQNTFINLNEISKIRIITALKGDKYYELKTKNGFGIDLDLNAIPERDLVDIANKFRIEIVYETSGD
jgi:hypothetical protein